MVSVLCVYVCVVSTLCFLLVVFPPLHGRPLHCTLNFQSPLLPLREIKKDRDEVRTRRRERTFFFSYLVIGIVGNVKASVYLSLQLL